MSIERAYLTIDRTLRERGTIHASYVLWGAVRSGTAVVDFAVPLESPNRPETIAVIESVLGEDRGRDRISAFAMELARLALERERRSAA